MKVYLSDSTEIAVKDSHKCYKVKHVVVSKGVKMDYSS